MPDCEIFRNHSVLEEVITVWKKNEIEGAPEYFMHAYFDVCAFSITQIIS